MFHFPTDEETFNNTEHSFIFANALKITPILDADTSKGDTVLSYFPKGTWVDMNNLNNTVVSEGGEKGWIKLNN
jgi:alpha-glucosidase (family GH31 glycosyl hydrolase)